MTEPILLEQQLCFSIYQAHKAFNHFYAKALAPFHLTYAQYVVLLALFKEDNVSVKKLGTQVGLDSGTLTPLLKRLEKDHWIARHRSVEDERRLEIMLTDHAHSQQNAIYQQVRSCQDNLDITDQQYDELVVELQNLTEELQQVSKQLD